VVFASAADGVDGDGAPAALDVPLAVPYDPPTEPVAPVGASFGEEPTGAYDPFIAAPLPAPEPVPEMAAVGAAGLFPGGEATVATPIVQPRVGGGDGDGPVGEKKKKKIPTSTKFLVIAIAWVGLVLVLINQFKHDAPEANLSAQLETNGATFDDGGTPDIIDTPEEEAADLNGDGVLDEQELELAHEAAAAAAGTDGDLAAGGEAGDGSGGGTTSGGSSGSDDPTAETLVPGAAPSGGGTATGGSTGGTTGGSSGDTTATTTSGGAGGGIVGGVTTTTAKSGGSGATTTTTAGGGGGGTATTTATTTAGGGGGGGTTTPTPTDTTITIAGNSGNGFTYSPHNFTVPAGSRVRMTNTSANAHTWKLGDGVAIPVAKGATTIYQTVQSTVTYRCTLHTGMTGTITVD
jgi:plastocyanin